ncbi:MAG TPA: hypothetical protein VGA99_08850 [bacterium]
MTAEIRDILSSFERLPETDKREVALEIIRRTLDFSFPPLSDEELVANAEDVFLELDLGESGDGHSKAGVRSGWLILA